MGVGEVVAGGEVVPRPWPRMTAVDYNERHLKQYLQLKGQTMKPINVDKDMLLKVLQENRAKHRTVFEDALTGYSREASKVLQDYLKAIRMGKTPDIHIILNRAQRIIPGIINRVIGMLTMHLGTTFELRRNLVQAVCG